MLKSYRKNHIYVDWANSSRRASSPQKPGSSLYRRGCADKRKSRLKWKTKSKPKNSTLPKMFLLKTRWTFRPTEIPWLLELVEAEWTLSHRLLRSLSWTLIRSHSCHRLVSRRCSIRTRLMINLILKLKQIRANRKSRCLVKSWIKLRNKNVRLLSTMDTENLLSLRLTQSLIRVTQTV